MVLKIKLIEIWTYYLDEDSLLNKIEVVKNSFPNDQETYDVLSRHGEYLIKEEAAFDGNVLTYFDSKFQITVV